MISLKEASELVQSGKFDPEKDLPRVPPDVFHLLDRQAHSLLAYVLEAPGRGRDPIEGLMPVLKNLASVCGWYSTASVLTYRMASWYRPENVPDMPGSNDDFLDLMRALPALRGESGVAPLLILAKAGEDEALEITAGVIMCASVGYVESSLEERADIDAS